MNYLAPADNSKLSPWYFAVHWSILRIQANIAEMERLGLDPSYDMRQLRELQDLEQFLKMSWDQWLVSLEESAKEYNK